MMSQDVECNVNEYNWVDAMACRVGTKQLYVS